MGLGESERGTVEITVTRSAGTDGAIVVFIDTDFEPDGSGDSPGLRVVVNDNDVFAPVPFVYVADNERPAKAVKLSVQLDEIAYVTDETRPS